MLVGTRWVLLASALAGLTNAFSRPVPAGHVVHEKRDPHNHSPWIKRSRIETSAILPVRIGLSQKNLDKGHNLLMKLSHPDSPKYGQWWSAEEVHDFFAPATETVELVRAWMQSAGIAEGRIVHSENKGWLAVDATVAEAEALFATSFYEYEHRHKDDVMIGTDSYHAPENLAEHINYVSPGLRMVRVKKRSIEWKRSSTKKRAALPGLTSNNQLIQAVGDIVGEITGNILPASQPDDGDSSSSTDPPQSVAAQQLDPSLQNCTKNAMSIPCLRALYGFPDNPQAVEGHSCGTYQTYDNFNQPDLDLYWSNLAPWVLNGTNPIPALIDGAQYDTSQNFTDIAGEATTSIDIIQAIIYPQNVTLYQVDDPVYSLLRTHAINYTISFNTFLDALDGSFCTYSAYGMTGDDPDIDPVYPNEDPKGYQGKCQLMCGTYKPTNVISLVWGEGEIDLPPRYLKRECDEFLKLGLQGVTILSATGDTGVAGNSYDPSPDGCLGPDHKIFNPFATASCPYVTAVGATQLFPNQTILDPEYAMLGTVDNTDGTSSNFSSSGGFSNLFAMPDYQKAAVQNYLDQYDPGYAYYEKLEPDFSTVKGIYNRIGRAMPDISAHGTNYVIYMNGEAAGRSGTSVSTPVLAGILTLINQERALVGKGPMGFMNPTLYAYPEILNDITKGNNVGCNTNGFNATPGWDAVTGLRTPNYPKMRDLWLSLP